MRPMQFLRRCGVGLGLSLLTLTSSLAYAADTAEAQLRRFLTDVPAALGKFTQTGGGMGGKAQGEFAFQRPGRFDWAVSAPYEQRIVADGRELFQFDPDLEQVTVRPLDQALAASPAQVLFGTGDIDRAFVIEPQAARDGLDWLRLTARSGDAGFAHLDVGWRDNLPVRLELLDVFGETTVIEFQELRPVMTLPSDRFTFTAPPGVDVVRM